MDVARSVDEFQSRLAIVRDHYRATPWIRPRHDESPLLRSWQRSRDHGLRPTDRVSFELVSRSLLAELDDRHGALIRLARPELERLGGLLQGTGCVVVLCSPRAMVIDRVLHEPSTPDPLRAVSRVGINLSERCIGTTAPTIALTEGVPYLVGRDAHYCASVRPYFCVSAPLKDPTGSVLGALDITSYDSVPAFDVMGLMMDATTAIENRLFHDGRERILVRFHVRAELVGTELCALLQLDEGGIVTGVNRACEQWLCTPRVQLIGRDFRTLFDRDARRLFHSASAQHGKVVELRAANGLQVWARFERGARDAPWRADDRSPPPLAATPLARSQAQADAMRPAAAHSLHELQQQAIDGALAELGGNVSATARRLRVSRSTIYRHLAARGAQG